MLRSTFVRLILAFGLCCLSSCSRAETETINVVAASDLSFPIREIIQDFERQSGSKVLLTLGSSGNFYAQILNGAPFDVFLSADVNYPKQLEQAGKTVPGSIFVYGVGGIAVWVPKTSAIDIETLGIQALAQPSVNKIAIANPEHAPYGRAAVAAMQSAGIYDRVAGRLVLGENISQAAQFVHSGAADVGIIALSIAMSEAMKDGRFWTIPRDTYPKLEQGAVLLKHGGEGAKAFLEWLKRPESRRIFEKYGFSG